MRKSFLSFLINHTILTLLLAVLFIAIKIMFPGFPIPDSIFIIFVFFFVFVLMVHGLLLRVAEKKAQVFIRVFMVMTFVKLFVYLGFISILILLYKSDAKGIVIVFGALYFVNLAHEITAILRHLDQKKSEQREV
ncbi:MAG TPA: hypothetical protein VGA21_02685 [Cyclobacteriaceae bacterium]|jgi:hypothetical protein